MIRICPSILNANFADLPNEILKVAAVSDLLHLDVMDGVFVPNKTFSFEEARKIIDNSPIPVDAHLMIADADRTALNYLQTKVSSITVHFEACSSPKELVRKIRGAGKRAGLAIKPDTPFSDIENLIEDLDMILIMTVEPGFGGQSFIDSMVPKIENARKWLDSKELGSTWLQVDGGINLETIKTARKAGADTFVAGSVVYKSDNPAAVITNLRKLANEE